MNKNVITFFTTLLVLIVPLTGVRAQEPSPSTSEEAAIIITAATLFIRERPSDHAEVLGSLSAGTSLQATGRDDTGNWVRIDYRGSMGWINTSYLTNPDEVVNLPVVTYEETAVSLPAIVPMEDVRALVYGIPSQTANQIGFLEGGTLINLLAADPTSTWGMIEYKGHTGWVAFFDLELSGSVSVLPPVTEFIEESFTVVAKSNLNVRAKDGTFGVRIALIPQATALNAIGRNSDGSWLLVAHDKGIGWVGTFYVWHEGEDVLSLPVVDEAADSTMEAVSPSGGVRLFSAPSLYSAALSSLPALTSFTISMVDPTLQWGKVETESQSGWVQLSAMNVKGDPRYVPVLGDVGQLESADANRPLSHDEREEVTHLQSYLAYLMPYIDRLEAGVIDPLMVCGSLNHTLESYFQQGPALILMPELNHVIRDLNATIAGINNIREPWLDACVSNTLFGNDDLDTWISGAQTQIEAFEQVQAQIAQLSTR